MQSPSNQELWAHLVGETPAEYLAACDLKTLNAFGDAELREQIGGSEIVKTVRVVTELVKRLTAMPIKMGQQVKCSKDVFDMYHSTLGVERQENFIVLLLDVKNRLIKERLISRGNLTASIFMPREVLAAAVVEMAAGIVLIHNHPSGDPTPSQDDLDVTARISNAGRIVGIKVLDHVIIGSGSYVSLADEGFIGP